MRIPSPLRTTALAVVAAGVLGTAVPPSPATDGSEAEHTRRRHEMVRLLENEVRPIRGFTGRAALDRRVLDVMARVPRHQFVPALLRPYAYQNRPLAIGHGQTISQPAIVALMTDLLDTRAGDTILEIGTGSGYQAAVLAELVERVYSIEIIPALGQAAAARLARLGYDNVITRVGDGYYGWPEQAPFDGIVVTAAAGSIPPPLLTQLAPGGRMVIPVGGAFQTQQLVLVEKDAEGALSTHQLLAVQFVPLTGGH